MCGLCSHSSYERQLKKMSIKVARPSEGLGVARLLMVLSSVSPLFVLWAIRGSHVIPDRWLIPACLAFIVVPNGFLWLRIRAAKRHNERRSLKIAGAEDHRDHLLVYLFAMLLPFYADEMAKWRAVSCALVALAFIVFVFWHLNLHYMNVFFAALRPWRPPSFLRGGPLGTPPPLM